MARTRTKLSPHAPRRQNRKALWITLAGVGLVLIAAWTLWSSRQTKTAIVVTGQPRLAVEATLIDYGDVRLGTNIHSEIRVTNTGDKPLIYQRKPYIEVREGC